MVLHLAYLTITKHTKLSNLETQSQLNDPQ
jgi:hypothetical protein